MKTRLLSQFTQLLFILLATAAYTQGSVKNQLVFVANLEGGQEVPAVATAAKGVASIVLSEDRSKVSIYGVFSGLSGPVTGCHFHKAAPGVNGPVVVNLSTDVSGNRLFAQKSINDELLENILKGEIYLNVHTAMNPGGEIRGQLKLSSDVLFGAQLTGGQEVPPVSTTAGGVGYFIYSPGHNKAFYRVAFNGLSGAMTAAHIHKAAAGSAGGVITPLSTGVAGTLTGEIDLSTMPGSFISDMEAKLMYINIHTAANGSGEIRGQMLPTGPIGFVATLNGDQENPPVTTGAVGVAVASISPKLDSLTYFVGATGLTPSAAHFHTGAAGINGGVMAPLQTTAMPNMYTGKIALTDQQVTDFLDGKIYANIHTSGNPTGEIRGQMEPMLRHTYAFDLCAQQEVPANGSTAIGSAVVSINSSDSNLSYFYVVDGLTGPATAAHFHGAAAGTNGGVLMPVALPNPAGTGHIEITGDVVQKIGMGEVYLNVHTAANPGGEVRGQVLQKLSCGINTAVFDQNIGGLEVFPNPSTGMTEVRFYSEKAFPALFRLNDLTGKNILRENYQVVTGSQALSFDMKDLPPGLYIASIASPSGLAFTLKVIKQ